MSFLPPPGPHRASRENTTWRRSWLPLTAEAGTAVFYLVAVSSGDFGFFGALPALLRTFLGCAAVALLLLRRKLPLMALLGLGFLAGVLPTVGLLTAVAAFTAARRTDDPRYRGGVLLAAAGLPVVISTVGTLVLGHGGWPAGFALGAVVGGVGVLIPGLVGSSVGQQERLLLALHDRAAAAEEARRIADSASRVEERSRIAAEMHDLVGHRLSLISLHTGGLELTLAARAPELTEDAAQIRLATRDAMRELREVLGVLGPLGRDTGTEALTDATGTRTDIDALAEESRAAGIPVDFTWHGADLDTLEPRVRRAVHRVVRESLTNVHRYATGAAVELAVTRTDDRVGVRIRNGAPPTPPEATTGLGTGRGLTGLRERVRLLGGELHTGPTPSGGFLVEAVLPTRPDAVAPADGDGPPPSGAPAIEAPRRSGALPDAARQPPGMPRQLPGALRRLPGVVRHLPGLAAAALGLAGVGAMLFFGLTLVQSSRPVQESLPDRTVRTGMTVPEVRAVTGADSDLVRAAAAGREPARSPGTSCLFPYRTDVGKDGRLPITRYCFRDGILVEITEFTVPLAPEGPPATGRPTPAPDTRHGGDGGRT
ncbi:sensor histidine kinase [Streptomyces celluloflavus]|uniref:sensor histidine kinase n=1 Tax=Streptomyces celluloflavus TaxID=58344 RepID=UPI003460876C|nr:histidine kinase [Streptomyces celluloflavus]